jgi:hypothetical protein
VQLCLNKLYPFVCCAIVLCACSDHGSDTASSKILRTEQGGDFRGVHIGDQPELVKSKENARSVYSMPDELVYRMNPTGEDSTWYEISYNFNKDGLYNINLEVFPTNEDVKKSIHDEFMSYYISKYGECKYFEGYCQWRALSENGHVVSITIFTGPSTRNQHYLKVNFNETAN